MLVSTKVACSVFLLLHDQTFLTLTLSFLSFECFYFPKLKSNIFLLYGLWRSSPQNNWMRSKILETMLMYGRRHTKIFSYSSLIPFLLPNLCFEPFNSISFYTRSTYVYAFTVQYTKSNAVLPSLFFATFLLCRFQTSWWLKKEDTHHSWNCSFGVKPYPPDFRNSLVERKFGRQDIKGRR